MVDATRRRFLTGLGALIAAPAIVRASSLMPVKVIEPSPVIRGDLAYYEGVQWHATDLTVAQLRAAKAMLERETLRCNEINHIVMLHPKQLATLKREFEAASFQVHLTEEISV